MTRLLQLYPRPWRDRHGDEMDALLVARAPGLRGRLDIVRGALDAHLHPELVPGPDGSFGVRPDTARRRLGVATMAGATLWVLAWALAGTGPMVTDEHGTYRDGGAAMLPYLASLWLLVFGIAGHIGRLPADGRITRIGAFAAMGGLALWSFGPWILAAGIVGIAGTAAFAFGAWRTGAWPGLPAAVLVAAVLLPLVPLALAGTGLVVASDIVIAVVAVGISSVAWLVVGAMHLGAVRSGVSASDGPLPT